jgi:hypothetical protein
VEGSGQENLPVKMKMISPEARRRRAIQGPFEPAERAKSSSDTGDSMSFDTRGTAIVHWCQDEQSRYNGIRRTDFSGTMTNIRGRDTDSKGHFFGTRLLLGDPQLRSQCGLITIRFRR